MDNLKLPSKILLLIMVCFFTIWLGGYIARQITIYMFFESTELNLKQLYNTNNLPAVLYTVIPLLLLNIITYTVFLLTYIAFLIVSGLNLKINGWLFIITLIIFVTAPFEIYLSFIDYKIISHGFDKIIQTSQIIELIKERLTKLSSFSLIEIFSFIVIIFLAIFKPFQKKYEN